MDWFIGIRADSVSRAQFTILLVSLFHLSSLFGISTLPSPTFRVSTSFLPFLVSFFSLLQFSTWLNKPQIRNPVPKVSNHHDNPTLQITTQKLNYNNFLEWSQAAKLFLCSQGKMGNLCKTVKEPKTLDHNFEKWEAKNSW